MKSTIEWSSTSAADDAALEGLRDLVEVLGDADYRLIGGLALSLLILATADELPSDVTQRSTADSDAVLKEAVLAAVDIDESLRERLYVRAAGNRWERTWENGVSSAVDVVVPSLTSRLVSRRVGGLVVDAIPGLLTALDVEPTPLDVAVMLRSGEAFELQVSVASPLGLLVSKAFASAGRAKDTDWPDLWRALEVAYAVGCDATSPEWAIPEALEAAEMLSRHLLNPNPIVARALGPDLADTARAKRATRVRALTQHLVPGGGT